jgi:hypothetical protein
MSARDRELSLAVSYTHYLLHINRLWRSLVAGVVTGPPRTAVAMVGLYCFHRQEGWGLAASLSQ